MEIMQVFRGWKSSQPVVGWNVLYQVFRKMGISNNEFREDFHKLEFGGEAPRPIRYEPWAENPQLLGPSTGTAAVNCCLAPVGHLSCSFRPRSSIWYSLQGKTWRNMHITPLYPNIQPWFQSGFADGMSKPIPYGVKCETVRQIPIFRPAY